MFRDKNGAWVSPTYLFVLIFSIFETESLCATEVGLELRILSQPCECYNYRHRSACSALLAYFGRFMLGDLGTGFEPRSLHTC